jgi:hypothetical protein
MPGIGWVAGGTSDERWAPEGGMPDCWLHANKPSGSDPEVGGKPFLSGGLKEA